MVKIITTSHFDREYVMSAGLYGMAPLEPMVPSPAERKERARKIEAARQRARAQARKEAKAKKQPPSP